MEQILDNELVNTRPDYKLYSEAVIGVGTFFGGPLAGGYFASENFRALGDTAKMRNTWLITLGFMAVLLAFIFAIPASQHMGVALPVAYTFGIRYLVKQYQGPQLEKHTASGGEMHSGWRALGVVVASLLAFFAIVMLVVVTTGVE